MAPSPTRARRAREGGGDGLPTTVESVQGEVVDQRPAIEAEAKVKEALREGKNALWKLAQALHDFDQARGWAALGYDSLNKWLEDPEIDMTRGTYYRLVRTWQKLVIDKKIAPAQLSRVDMSKAALVADNIVEGGVRPTIALRDVREMSAQQLREKYEKPRRGRPPKSEGRRREQVAESPALKAAADLPWQWVEQAVSGRAPIALREARLQEALGQLLAWHAEYLG